MDQLCQSQMPGIAMSQSLKIKRDMMTIKCGPLPPNCMMSHPILWVLFDSVRLSLLEPSSVIHPNFFHHWSCPAYSSIVMYNHNGHLPQLIFIMDMFTCAIDIYLYLPCVCADCCQLSKRHHVFIIHKLQMNPLSILKFFMHDYNYIQSIMHAWS